MNSFWIWNYGDYEIYHSNMVNCRRQQYGADYPPFWRLYDVDRNVKFMCEKEIPHDGYFVLRLIGKGNITVDGKRYPSDKKVFIKAGKHFFEISVFNLSGLPAAYIESDVLLTDGEWYTEDTESKKIPVGFDKEYTLPSDNPERFKFALEKKEYLTREEINCGVLFDFGVEIFGFLYVYGAQKDENIHISYGESREEALDIEWAVVQEDVCGSEFYTLRQRAFRYVFITGCKNPNVCADLEYLPLEYKGSFECDDKAINDIWNMCAYTLKLNSREVFTEAVKRDRWLWGGDAYQTFKFAKYLYFDKDIVRRSIIALRGKEPFTQHINTITDYSLYWVISLWEYYSAYGDFDFIKFIYPRAVSLMEFCRKRTNEIGFIVGKGKDWLFIDWSEIDKSGVVCAEQMLYYAALVTMSKLAEVLGEENKEYLFASRELLNNINKYFWNDSKGAYIDNYLNDCVKVTRHANVFAVMYGIADAGKTESIVKNVFENDKITKITTPYFEGYELDALGKVGKKEVIFDMLKSYWKGMLDLGATTVWEEYNPELSGVEHYAMYGDKFQKSLCHAWGASPIYLLGKYWLGVEETLPGYKAFTVKPYLGKLKYIKGTVPVKGGKVEVFLSKTKLSVKADIPGGTLIWQDKEYILEPCKEMTFEF